MFKKLMKHLTNNLGLKFLSLLFSVVLWLVVVNVADPDATKSFSVPVEILNKNVITEMGKVPDIVGDTDIAVFYITGPRSYVEDMSGDDFTVTADLSQIDLSQEGEQKLVPIEISAKKNERRINIIRRSMNMQIKLEDLSEQKFIISAETTGTPADGCAIGEVEVTPNLLKVSGPNSVVSRISRVTATINVDGISGDVSDNVMPVLYDEEGNVVPSDMLEMNQSIVTIKAKILGTKSVSINCQVSGAPADGYVCTGVEYAPEEIVIKGEAATLNRINVIDIPADVVDISGATKDVDATIDITPYLQELGVSLADDTDNQIAVKAHIVQKESRVINLPVDDIKVNGLDRNYKLNYIGNNVSITVRALSEDMEQLQEADITAAIDVSGLDPGQQSVPLTVTLPSSKYELVGEVTIQVMIEDENELLGEPDNGAGTDAGNGNQGEDGENNGGNNSGNNSGENNGEDGGEDSEREEERR